MEELIEHFNKSIVFNYMTARGMEDKKNEKDGDTIQVEG